MTYWNNSFEFNGKVYGKPKNNEEAIKRWLAMSSKSGLLHTGHALVFEIAKNKNWKTVVPLYKANILKITDGMFFDSVKKIGSDYPDIAIEDYFIDNFAQQIVKNPQRFNQTVVLSTNLFMDVTALIK